MLGKETWRIHISELFSWEFPSLYFLCLLWLARSLASVFGTARLQKIRRFRELW